MEKVPLLLAAEPHQNNILRFSIHGLFYQEILWSCSSNMVMPDVLSVVILSRNAAATLTRCTATGRAGDRRIHRSPHHEQPKALDVNNIPLQNQSTVSNGMRFPKPKLQSGKES